MTTKRDPNVQYRIVVDYGGGEKYYNIIIVIKIANAIALYVDCNFFVRQIQMKKEKNK